MADERGTQMNRAINYATTGERGIGHGEIKKSRVVDAREAREKGNFQKALTLMKNFFEDKPGLVEASLIDESLMNETMPEDYKEASKALASAFEVQGGLNFGVEQDATEFGYLEDGIDRAITAVKQKAPQQRNQLVFAMHVCSHQIENQAANNFLAKFFAAT